MGSAALGKFFSIDRNFPLSQLSLELWIDGLPTQKGGVENMLFKPDEILDDIKQFIDLEDGDVIMTGTPEGVGEVVSGAEFVGRVF